MDDSNTCSKQRKKKQIRVYINTCKHTKIKNKQRNNRRDQRSKQSTNDEDTKIFNRLLSDYQEIE